MIVGVTGHQRLDDPSAWGWVESAMSMELDLLPLPLIGVTCLAIGADQMFAFLIARHGGKIRVIIPFEDYEGTFAADDLVRYRQILASATHVEVLKGVGSEEDAFLAAGKRVVALADLMIAVWDAEATRGKGGTADIVKYSEETGVPLVHIDPRSKMVRK